MDECKKYFKKLSIDYSNNVVYVFVDASNLWEAQKAKGKFLDWEKTLNYIKDNLKTSVVKVFYYTAYPAQGTRNYDLDGKHKFFTFLKKGLGFEVVKKELKRISTITDHGEVIKEKGNMDVEMTIGAVHQIEKYQTAIFFTGDSDFLALVVYLRQRNKKVFIFSSKNNISEELRTGSNGYFDLIKIEEIWGRELKHRLDK